MKTLTVTLTGILAVAISGSALAGPNWDVIHEGEARHFAHHEVEHVVPLDHGPRAITTPYLNKVNESESQVAAVVARQSRQRMVAVATVNTRTKAHN